MSGAPMTDQPKADQFEFESDTPMTDLCVGGLFLEFFSAGWGEVYHGYYYDYDADDDFYHSFCHRDILAHPWGSVFAYAEEDISPVRRPCKLCLAVLRKAKKGG